MRLQHLLAALACKSPTFNFENKPVEWFNELYAFLSTKRSELLHSDGISATGEIHRPIDDLFQLPILRIHVDTEADQATAIPAMCPVYMWPLDASGPSSRLSQYKFGQACLKIVHHSCVNSSTVAFMQMLAVRFVSLDSLLCSIIDFHLKLPSTVCASDDAECTETESMETLPRAEFELLSSIVEEHIRFLCDYYDEVTFNYVPRLEIALLLPAIRSKSRHSVLIRPKIIYFPEVQKKYFSEPTFNVVVLDRLNPSNKDVYRLMKALGVNEMPRLMRGLGEYYPKMSPEFEQWFEFAKASQSETKSSAVLETLDLHWNHYMHCPEIKSFVMSLRKMTHLPLRVQAEVDNAMTQSFTFNECFIDVPTLRAAAGDYLPVLGLAVTNPDLLNTLGVHQSLSKESLRVIHGVFVSYRVNDATAWKTLYKMLQKLEMIPPIRIFYPLETGYDSMSVKSLRAQGDPDLARHLKLGILADVFPNEVELCNYLVAIDTRYNISLADCQNILHSVCNVKEPGKKHEGAPPMRTPAEIKELLPLLEKTYCRIDEILAEKRGSVSHTELGEMVAKCLILDSTYRMRGIRSSYVEKGFIIPDNSKIAKAFERSRVLFLNTVIADNCPNLCSALQTKLPLLSALLETKPNWSQGDQILSTEHTLKYRAAISLALDLSGKLEREERDKLLELQKKLLVFTVTPYQQRSPTFSITYQLPVVTKEDVNGYWKVSLNEQFFFDKSRVVLFIPAGLVSQLDKQGKAILIPAFAAAIGFDPTQNIEKFMTPNQINARVEDMPQEYKQLDLPVDFQYTLQKLTKDQQLTIIDKSQSPLSSFSSFSSYSGSFDGSFPARSRPSASSSSSSSSQYPNGDEHDFYSHSMLSPDRVGDIRSTEEAETRYERQIAAAMEHFGQLQELLQSSDTDRMRAVDENVTHYRKSLSVNAADSDAPGHFIAQEILDLPEIMQTVFSIQQEHLEQIAQLTEAFVFKLLQHEFPHAVTASSWRSHFRSCLLERNIEIEDDSVGYDIEYVDPSTGRTVYVEVKGSMIPFKTFHITQKEWNVAEQCSSVARKATQKRPNCEYVIVCVALLPKVRIVRRIRDPYYECEISRSLVLEPESYKATVSITPPSQHQTQQPLPTPAHVHLQPDQLILLPHQFAEALKIAQVRAPHPQRPPQAQTQSQSDQQLQQMKGYEQPQPRPQQEKKQKNYPKKPKPVSQPQQTQKPQQAQKPQQGQQGQQPQNGQQPRGQKWKKAFAARNNGSTSNSAK